MKALITDMFHPTAAEEQKIFDACGLELDTTFCRTEDDIIRNGQDAIGLLVSYSKITRHIFESLPKLKIVVKYGIGVDTIDLRSAAEHGVIISNVPDYCLEEVASQAMMLIFNGLRQTPYFMKNLREKQWVTDLKEKIIYRPSEITLGLVSFGRIARTLAKYAQPIFKKVLFYDPYFPEEEFEGCKKVNNLKEIFSLSKVISVHTPLNDSTEGLVDESVISHAKELILVNTSRAAVIEPKSVENGLNNGSLLFFGADTFWPEPPDFSNPWAKEFLNRDDVLITPHCGWYSVSSEKEVRRKAAEAVAKVYLGEEPSSIIKL